MDGLFSLTLPLSFPGRNACEFELSLDITEFSDIKSLQSPTHPR